MKKVQKIRKMSVRTLLDGSLLVPERLRDQTTLYVAVAHLEGCMLKGGIDQSSLLSELLAVNNLLGFAVSGTPSTAYLQVYAENDHSRIDRSRRYPHRGHFLAVSIHGTNFPRFAVGVIASSFITIFLDVELSGARSRG